MGYKLAFLDTSVLISDEKDHFVSVRLQNYNMDTGQIIKLADILNDSNDKFLSFAPFYSTSN